MTALVGGELPNTRKVLAQARRQLDELKRRENTVDSTEYLDLIPYVLDRLLHVWQTLDDETKGNRTDAFATWWKTQLGGNRDSIRRLRNLEMKQNVRLSKSSRIYKFPNQLEVLEDGTKKAIRPDGSITPRLPDGNLDLGPVTLNHDAPHSSRWEFAVSGLEGREVQEVLELVYMRLEEEVLPTAERTMAE